MSLFCLDIDAVIASHIFGGNSRWNLELIKKIYYAFGKSTYNSFLRTCRDTLLEIIYKKYDTRDFDVVLKKTIVRGTPRFFPCYKIFAQPCFQEELCKNNQVIRSVDRNLLPTLQGGLGHVLQSCVPYVALPK